MPENEPYLSVAIKAVLDSGKLAETISKHFAALSAASAKTTIAKIHAMTPTHPFGTVLRYPPDNDKVMVIGWDAKSEYIEAVALGERRNHNGYMPGQIMRIAAFGLSNWVRET